MKILMIFLLMLGGICQAQVSREDTEIIKSINTHIQSIDLKVKVMQEINKQYYDQIIKLNCRVYELEQLANRLEQKAIQDSLYYQRLVQPFDRLPQLDSIEHYPLWQLKEIYYPEGKRKSS